VCVCVCVCVEKKISAIFFLWAQRAVGVSASLLCVYVSRKTNQLIFFFVGTICGGGASCMCADEREDTAVHCVCVCGRESL